MSEVGTVVCPYCNNVAEFFTSEEFYGKDYGINIYACKPCDASVGTHKRSKKPKGTLANKTLRNLRKACHSMFDPLWKNGEVSRTDSYKLIQEWMDVSKDEAHIALFTEEQCHDFLEKVTSYRGISYKPMKR